MSMKIVGNTGSKNPSIWNDLDKEYFSKKKRKKTK